MRRGVASLPILRGDLWVKRWALSVSTPFWCRAFSRTCARQGPPGLPTLWDVQSESQLQLGNE